MIPIQEWRARGRTVHTADGRVWALEAGTRREGEASVLVLHGFPTCAWDFGPMIDRIAYRRHVVALDFLGFGLSDKPSEHGYSIFEHADTAELVARAFGVSHVHVVAHDMGTSVATELCARRERGLLAMRLASVALMNGSIHIELAHLTLGQHALRSPLGALFAKLNTRATFKAQMRRVFGRVPSDQDLDGMWDLVSREDGLARLPQTIRYVEERRRFRRRWVGALERLNLPVLVAWGKLDPVAVFPIAEQLAREIPGAELVSFDDLGHYPQVEDPPRVAAALMNFWDRL